MKPKHSLRHFLAALGCATLAVSSASAADVLWSANGSTQGGAGTWNTADARWGTVAAGPYGTIWDNANNDTAIFGSTGGAISLGTNITAGGLTFNTNSYSISAGNTLTLAGDSTPIINVVTSGHTATINSIIAGTDGLQKDGAGILKLTGTNDFTGGITITNGRLIAGSDAALGATSNGITFTGTQGALLLPTGTFTLDSNRTITSQSGAMAVISRENINNRGTINIGSKLTGQGGFQFSTGYQLGGVTYNLSNASNDFQGALRIGGDYAGVHTFTPSTVTLNMASLADGAGYGNIQFGRGNNGSGNILTLNYTSAAATDLVLNNRRIELGSSVETAHLSNSSTTYGIIVNTDLLISRAGNKTLRLSAVSGSNNNVFAGDIADGTNAVIAIEKASPGTWALGGTNTYSGRTTLAQANPAAGGITFQGMQAVSENTELYQRHGGGSGGHGTWKFLDDSATPTFRSMVDILHVQRNASQNSLSVFVGNNSTANGGTSASTQTGSAIQLGNLTFQQEVTGATGGARLNLTGANDYGLQLGNVNVELQAAYTGTWNVRLDAISAGLTVGGNVQQAAGSLGMTNLQLDGDVNGNVISGNILDSTDVTPQALSVTKEGVNTWTLSGANTYSGNTTINAGHLEIGGSGTLGNVSAGVGDYSGNISIASTSSGKLVYNSSATQTFSGVISGAGALFVEDGSLRLGNASNTYTGATTVNGGTLLINGSTSTSSAVSVGVSGTLGGNGTVGGATTVNGNLRPGTSPGVLTFTNSLTLAGTTATTMEINGTVRETGYDGVDVGTALTYGGTLTLAFGTTFGTDQTFNLFDLFTSQSGSFSSVSLTGSYSGSLVDDGFGVWSATTSSGNESWVFTQSTGDLALTVIPEPSSALFGALGAMLLLRRRR